MFGRLNRGTSATEPSTPPSSPATMPPPQFSPSC